jgi:hypothetical protein
MLICAFAHVLMANLSCWSHSERYAKSKEAHEFRPFRVDDLSNGARIHEHIATIQN